MARARNVPKTRQRHRKYLKAAKGYVGGRGKQYRMARETVERAWGFATDHRRLKKRDFRQLWNAQVSAGARESGLTYSKLIHGLKKSKIQLNRKMLAVIAQQDNKTFRELVDIAKTAK